MLRDHSALVAEGDDEEAQAVAEALLRHPHVDVLYAVACAAREPRAVDVLGADVVDSVNALGSR